MSKPVIIVGAGDHGAVLADTLLLNNREILGLTDPALSAADTWRFGLPILGDDGVIARYPPDKIELVNGMGFLPRSRRRRTVYLRWLEQGYRFANVIHPAATIGREVAIGQGVQVMAGAVINTGAAIGDNCIINSASVIEHDVVLGKHCHVAPGAVVCGGTEIGEACFIGANATVIHYQQVAAQSVIQAGTLVSGKQRPENAARVRNVL